MWLLIDAEINLIHINKAVLMPLVDRNALWWQWYISGVTHGLLYYVNYCGNIVHFYRGDMAPFPTYNVFIGVNLWIVDLGRTTE